MSNSKDGCTHRGGNMVSIVRHVVDVWFWRVVGGAAIRAYDLRVRVAKQAARLGPGPTAALAFGVPFVGGLGVGLFTVVLRAL